MLSIAQPSFACPLPQSQALAAFLSHCTRFHRPKHFVLCRPGDVSSSLMYLVSGIAAVFATEPTGDLLLDQIHPGAFIGEVGLFKPIGNREVLIRAKTPIEVAEIPCQKFLSDLDASLSEHAPALLYLMATQMAERLLSTRRKASSLALLDVRNRIRRSLLDLRQDRHAVESAEGHTVRISRRDLAQRVGCSREVAGRTIKRLAVDGFLQDHGRTLLICRQP